MSRILVVDDDPIVLEHARLCLTSAGHAVDTANDGECGLALARTGGYDLILADVYMPRLGGFELAQRLRGGDHEPPAPVVFISSVEDRQNYRQALEARGVDYLVKPVSCSELREVARTRAAAAARPLAEAEPARPRVPGFRMERLLGSGMSASVWLARRESSGEECALKVVRLPPEQGDQRPAVERFLTEASVLRSIDHPCVARVLEHGVADDCLFIALEYLPGGSLEDRPGEAHSPAVALGISLQVAHALAAIHAMGIVHRDVKPANVMRRGDGRYALVDFGIAQRGGHGLTAHGADFLGTPSFMSPEQFRAERADARTDVYALGCLLYQLLTGEVAFRADSLPELYAAHVEGPRPRLPGNLASFQDLLDSMLAADRGQRLPDGAAVARELQALRDRLYFS